MRTKCYTAAFLLVRELCARSRRQRWAAVGALIVLGALEAVVGLVQATGEGVGDGGGTRLLWTGSGKGPVLRVLGPSKATLRDLAIDGAGKADGVVVEKVDQMGARVYLDQAQLLSGKQTNLFVNGLDDTYVQVEDVGYAYSPEAVSIKVTGGPRLRAGLPSAGRVNIFSGASSGNRISYDVSDGARVLVRDLWYESGAGPGFARIHGRATFTVDGARISSAANRIPPAFDITNLDGAVTVVSTDLDDRLTIAGNGSAARVLGLGVVAEQKAPDYFENAASPSARALLLNSRHLATTMGNRSVATKDIGRFDPAFVESLLSHTRGEQPEVLRALPNGVTDVRLFRVWMTNGLNNLTLQP